MKDCSKADVSKLLGRILMALIFIMSGWSKLMGFEGAVGYAGTVLPFPEVMVVIAIILELGGGLMLLVGYKMYYAASGLILFTVVSLAFHTDFADQTQMVMFMKNLAMVGGLLYMKACGPGKFALGGNMKKEAPMAS